MYGERRAGCGGGLWRLLVQKGFAKLEERGMEGSGIEKESLQGSRGEVGRFFGLPLVKRACFPTSISSIPPLFLGFRLVRPRIKDALTP